MFVCVSSPPTAAAVGHPEAAVTWQGFHLTGKTPRESSCRHNWLFLPVVGTIPPPAIRLAGGDLTNYDLNKCDWITPGGKPLRLTCSCWKRLKWGSDTARPTSTRHAPYLNSNEGRTSRDGSLEHHGRRGWSRGHCDQDLCNTLRGVHKRQRRSRVSAGCARCRRDDQALAQLHQAPVRHNLDSSIGAQSPDPT